MRQAPQPHPTQTLPLGPVVPLSVAWCLFTVGEDSLSWGEGIPMVPELRPCGDPAHQGPHNYNMGQAYRHRPISTDGVCDRGRDGNAIPTAQMRLEALLG